jgi:general stress protein YciG
MTTNSPRIYVYKITFYEVLHYYYGLHKEKRFDEYYMGSPVTHKDFWELYTPKKEYIEFFEYSDEGYTEARIFEDSLIAPVYNTDPLCLNEHCGGFLSLEACRIGGQRAYVQKKGIHSLTIEEKRQLGEEGGKKSYELGVGVHARSKEEMSEHGKKSGKIGGKRSYELGVGAHARSKEEMSEHGKKSGKIGGQRTYELGVGIFERSKDKIIEDGKKAYESGLANLSKEQLSENGKKGGEKAYELLLGCHGLTKEQKSENGKKGGEKAYELKVGVHARSKEQIIKDASNAGKVGGKVSCSQKWQCTVTGYVSNPGGLSRYQKKRGIDTSNRIKIQ